MIYAYDKPAKMPTMDIYDTLLMAMAVNAAKLSHDEAEERLEKLNKLYSDFYSPSKVDMNTWENQIVKPFRDTIDDLLRRGIDPTRSTEGKAALAMLSRSIDYGLINRMKGTAEIGKKYLENAGKLAAENKYDEDFEKFQGHDIENWDSRNGVFDVISPTPMNNLREDTEFLYKGRTPGLLTPKQVIDEGKEYNPEYDYTGYPKETMREVAQLQLEDLSNTPWGRYRRQLIRQSIEDERKNKYDYSPVTEEDVNKEFIEQIVNANSAYHVSPVGELKKEYEYKYSGRGRSGGYGGRSSGGGNDSDDNNFDYGYNIQDYLLNEGLSRLTGLNVDAAAAARNSNSNLLAEIVTNQENIFNNRTVSGGINTTAALDDLSFRYDRSTIAEILGLRDYDKENLLYSISHEDLRDIYAKQHLVSRVKLINNHFSFKGDTSTALRNKYLNYKRNEIKVSPTGEVLTYLNKDGIIVLYAKVKLMAQHIDPATGKTSNSTSDYVYMDLGTFTNQVKNKDEKTRTRDAVDIDYTRSTLRRKNYEDLNKKAATDKTQTIKTDHSS